MDIIRFVVQQAALMYLDFTANKQFMSLNWGNAFYPIGRLSNNCDFLSLSLPLSSFLVLGKKNTWHSSTDNTEAYYLLHALQGSSET